MNGEGTEWLWIIECSMITKRWIVHDYLAVNSNWLPILNIKLNSQQQSQGAPGSKKKDTGSTDKAEEAEAITKKKKFERYVCMNYNDNNNIMTVCNTKYFPLLFSWISIKQL